PEGTRFLGLTPKPRADERRTRAQRARDRDEEARRGSHRSLEEFAFAHGAERDGRIRERFERLDLAPRHLEEPPRDGCDGGAADIHTDTESERERKRAGRSRR